MKTSSDMQRLRNLAGKYAEYALGEPMPQRREKWRLHNRLQEKTFPFHIEDNGNYFRDLCPPLECEDDECRNLESRLVRALVAYETIDDDRIIPDRFVVDWVSSITEICDELVLTHAHDRQGGSFGYASNKPIKDIDRDFHKLKRREETIDAKATDIRAGLAREAFEGLMPVVVGRPSTHYSDGITNRAVHLMGMQELYLQMAMNPEAIHRLLGFIADDNTVLGQREEEHRLLTLNNDGNQGYCSGSSQFSDEIPGRILAGDEDIEAADRYGYLEAQEAVGISPDMFGEFLMPHFLTFSKKFKLMKFGCCEPVHDLMDHLHSLNGLRKVSVTPWCDQEKLATVCNKDIIWSRKPIPLKLCDTVFNPDEFTAHLEETMRYGKDFHIEFIFRDTNRLTGDMRGRLAQACDIVRRITGHPEGSKNAKSA